MAAAIGACRFFWWLFFFTLLPNSLRNDKTFAHFPTQGRITDTGLMSIKS